jgi:phosphohistidine phosphatase
VQSSRTLVIMRHANAEPTAASDEERVLTERGESDARAAGRWLAEEGTVVDHALLSSAARVLGTWARVAEGAGLDLEPEVDSTLYSAGPETALDVIRLAADDVQALLVVGHNPTMASVAQMLDDGEGEPGAIEEMIAGFPAAAVAVFDVPGGWADLEFGGARLRAFHVGRG